MLTSNLVRVRHARNRLVPLYLDADDPTWLAAAERLLDLFRGREGVSRSELDEDLADAFGDEQGQLVFRGLAKLLEDRCDFEVVSGLPPEQLRDAVFRAAADRRKNASAEVPGGVTFDRDAVLNAIAQELGVAAEAVDAGLFADLKGEQRLITFKDISAERLLQRYNVALAQALLLRATRVDVLIRHEPPARYRQLLRLVKFHRLICEIVKTGPDCCRLSVDGPLSLFSATQKYGLQLALFLPAILLCRDFELKADILWGPRKQPKTFEVVSSDKLVSPMIDAGTYVPPEMAMFVDLFRKRIATWDIAEETEVFPLGEGFWVPDFRLTHRATRTEVFLEVLGFWRKASAEQHLQRLRAHASQPFLLAVSDALHIDEAELEGLPAGVHRFRQMPLPDEVARLADEVRAHHGRAAVAGGPRAVKGVHDGGSLAGNESSDAS